MGCFEKVKDNFQLRTIQLQLQVKFSDVCLVDHPDIFYTLLKQAIELKDISDHFQSQELLKT